MNKSNLTGMLMLTGTLLFPIEGVAQSITDIHQCETVTAPPDDQIAACTRLIESGKHSHLDAAYAHRGSAWQLKDDFDRAIADYNESIRLSPKNPAAFYDRGNAWRSKGNLDRAIADYNEAIRLYPKFAFAFGDRGYAYSLKGNLDHALADYNYALADYNEAIRLDPQDGNAFYYRGVLWGFKRDFDRAIEDYDEAIRLFPQDGSYFHMRGIAWSSKGNLDHALADYSEAIRLNPRDETAFRSRGNILANMGEFDRAIADYNDAIRLNPQYAYYYIVRGSLQFTEGKFVLAADDYATANRIDNSIASAVLGFYLSRMHAGISAHDDLVRLAKTLQSDKWPEPAVNLYLGNLKPEALITIAANPDSKTQAIQQCQADYYIGEWYLLQNDLGHAKNFLSEAQTNCPYGKMLITAELKRLQQKE